MNHLVFALRRSAHLGLAAMLVLVMAACAPADDGGNGGNGGTDAAATDASSGGGSTATVSGGSVEITAENLEFSANTIEAPAGEPFTITLVNNDSAPHNISVYTEEGGEVIVEGEVINQGETTEVEVPALDAGEYFFVCDIHPDMNGTVVVGG